MRKILLPLLAIIGLSSCDESEALTNYDIVRKEYPNGIILSESPYDNQTDWYVVIGDAYYKVVVSGNLPKATLLVERYNPMYETSKHQQDTSNQITQGQQKEDDSLIIRK